HRATLSARLDDRASCRSRPVERAKVRRVDGGREPAKAADDHLWSAQPDIDTTRQAFACRSLLDARLFMLAAGVDVHRRRIADLFKLPDAMDRRASVKGIAGGGTAARSCNRLLLRPRRAWRPVGLDDHF